MESDYNGRQTIYYWLVVLSAARTLMKSQMQWLRYSREQLQMLVFSGLVAVSVKADSFALHSQRSQTRTIT